ncbi:hypothetical protein C7T35_01290 [Variovorax sp. WS11]|uniref:hypothetical protein n=1 Tax=Variovorax sp. WS11 TaxID=1105204 RepID=UPI000D0E0CFF|nr:hypothetical protein [Variovorax sp. WS11]NDZ11513.1 hypothetical protein [Variovorax sp. WS11]PSL86631.1 hypothetical protein C7T35_01290 [Variovorax sp. WS11]
MKLFYDDEFDAITQAVNDSSKSWKEVAAHIFPDMKPDSAYAKLKVCASPTGDQRLTFGQVIRLMVFCEAYDPLMHACDETLHARPDRKTPADEEVKLVEVINGAANTLNRAMKTLEQLKARQAVRAVA